MNLVNGKYFRLRHHRTYRIPVIRSVQYGVHDWYSTVRNSVSSGRQNSYGTVRYVHVR